jgi:hypothetical protein
VAGFKQEYSKVDNRISRIIGLLWQLLFRVESLTLVAMKVKINGMIRTFLLFTFALYALSSLAQNEQTVTDAAGTDFEPLIKVDLVVQPIAAGAVTNFEISATSSNGLTEATAPNIYVPFRSTDDGGSGNTINDQFSFYADRDNLPRIDNNQSVENAVALRFRLNINITTLLSRLYVAIKGDSGSYKVLADLGDIAADTSLSIQDISITDICGSDEVDCNTLDKDNDPGAVPEAFTLHFFLGVDMLGPGDGYTPGADNGVYYNVNFSARVFDDRRIDLFDLRKGDSQLVADYSGFTMSEILGLYGIVSSRSGVCATNVVDASNDDDTMESLGLSFSDLVDLRTNVILGQEKFEDLSNGLCYTVRFIQCDFYGFCSFASQSYEGSPEDIETLLKKQACFFFTAGFGREHFVVDFFQDWRNKVLKRFWVGRAFINWYYKTAPQYTPYILRTPWLQKTIQYTAYILYGVIKAWWLLSLFVVLAIVHFARKKTVLNRQS